MGPCDHCKWCSRVTLGMIKFIVFSVYCDWNTFQFKNISFEDHLQGWKVYVFWPALETVKSNQIVLLLVIMKTTAQHLWTEGAFITVVQWIWLCDPCSAQLLLSIYMWQVLRNRSVGQLFKSLKRNSYINLTVLANSL